MTVKKFATIVGVMALIAIMGLMVVVPAFAQAGTPEAQATPNAQTTPEKPFGRGLGLGGCFGGGGTASFDAAAEALKLTPTQLFEQLHSGKTLSEIATAQGVDLQTVQDAMSASQTQAMKDRIAQAVKDGTLTQEQADWMLQGIEKGYMGKGGFGMGGHGMRGGMRGERGLFGPQTAPTAPATGTES